MTADDTVSTLITSASPEGWSWSVLDASRPRRAIEHVTHSEVSPVVIDRVRPADVPPGSQWTLDRDIPIIIVDTFDACWAFESVLNKVQGYSRTVEEAKSDLVNKLGNYLRLLTSLESPGMAPILKLELEFLRAVLRPVEDAGRDA